MWSHTYYNRNNVLSDNFNQTVFVKDTPWSLRKKVNIPWRVVSKPSSCFWKHSSNSIWMIAGNDIWLALSEFLTWKIKIVIAGERATERRWEFHSEVPSRAEELWGINMSSSYCKSWQKVKKPNFLFWHLNHLSIHYMCNSKPEATLSKRNLHEHSALA